MRTLALLIVPVLAFGAAGTASAAAVSNNLKAAANKSFAALKAHDAGRYGTDYSKDRLHISSNGKTARVEIQAFGKQPGPPRMSLHPDVWHAIKTATFAKKADGNWSKQGKWNTLFFALSAGR